MKALPFLIFILIILLLLSFSKTKAQNASVQVSTTIDEHLSYAIINSQSGQKLYVATNNPSGFLILSKDSFRQQNFGPSEQFFDLVTTNFIITVNF